MADIADLHNLASQFLIACTEALDTVNAFDGTLQGAQDRKFISPGTPVLDCPDQLAIHIPTIAPKDTTPAGDGKRHLTGMITHVTMQVWSNRCIPVGSTSAVGNYTAPTAAELAEAARQLDADAWALWNHLYALQASGLLRSLCDEVFFDGISAQQPSGASAGWIAQVRCSLDGYPVAFGT